MKPKNLRRAVEIVDALDALRNLVESAVDVKEIAYSDADGNRMGAINGYGALDVVFPRLCASLAVKAEDEIRKLEAEILTL